MLALGIVCAVVGAIASTIRNDFNDKYDEDWMKERRKVFHAGIGLTTLGAFLAIGSQAVPL